MSRTITVTGLDLAAVNSGFCKVKACAVSSWPPLDVQVIDYAPIELEDKTPLGRLDLAKEVSLRVSGSDDLVALEDYARRVGSTNTTAYECGEFVGPAKAYLHKKGSDVLLVPPTTMRSLISVPKGKEGKSFIQKWVKETFDFVPECRREKQRSDVADAFMHAYIGALYWFAANGGLFDGIHLNDREYRIIYGNEDHRKTKNFIGLLDRPHILVKGKDNGSTSK